jgi:hypothetical protein
LGKNPMLHSQKKEIYMKQLIALMFVFGISAPTFAHDMEMKDLSKDDRAKLAEIHDKMANCLRSDKSMKDCHEEMKASCDADQNCKAMMAHKMERKMEHKKMKKEEKKENK